MAWYLGKHMDKFTSYLGISLVLECLRSRVSKMRSGMHELDSRKGRPNSFFASPCLCNPYNFLRYSEL